MPTRCSGTPDRRAGQRLLLSVNKCSDRAFDKLSDCFRRSVLSLELAHLGPAALLSDRGFVQRDQREVLDE